MDSLTLIDGAPPTLPPPGALPYFWWQEALDGRPGKFETLAPQTGFYRFRPRKSDRGEPCAVWFAEGAWWCLIGDRMVENIVHAWRWSHGQPITEELYEAVRAGGPWPNEVAQQVEPTIGHNSGLPQDEIRDEIQAADDAFNAWLKQSGPIDSDEKDQIAEGYRLRFLTFRKRIEDAHKAAKAPILEQGREIDAAWITGDGSVKAVAQACQDNVARKVQDYRQERKRLADEAAKAEREARAAARAAGAPEPSRNVAKPATGLRKVESVVLDDPEALAVHLVKLKNAEMLDLLAKLGLRLLKAGAAAPGARIITEFKA